MVIYLFMVILLDTGIIVGAIIVNSMTFIQKQDLFFHVDRYFMQLNTEEAVHSMDILKRSFFFHVKYLCLFFLLGITIIGIPAVRMLLLIKGIVIGVSVGLMVSQLGRQGLLLATFATAPPTMVIIP